MPKPLRGNGSRPRSTLPGARSNSGPGGTDAVGRTLDRMAELKKTEFALRADDWDIISAMRRPRETQLPSSNGPNKKEEQQ